VLLVASLLITALGAIVFVPSVPNHLELYVLFGFLFIVGIFGTAVSIWGCNACVARAFGDAF